MTPQLKLRTAAEVAEMLGLTKGTIWKMCREKRIPHHVFGRDVRFSDADILAILQASRVEAEEAPLRAAGRTR